MARGQLGFGTKGRRNVYLNDVVTDAICAVVYLWAFVLLRKADVVFAARTERDGEKHKTKVLRRVFYVEFVKVNCQNGRLWAFTSARVVVNKLRWELRVAFFSVTNLFRDGKRTNERTNERRTEERFASGKPSTYWYSIFAICDIMMLRLQAAQLAAALADAIAYLLTSSLTNELSRKYLNSFDGKYEMSKQHVCSFWFKLFTSTWFTASIIYTKKRITYLLTWTTDYF